MTQQSFLDPPIVDAGKIARTADPVTSHQAAKKIVKTGAADSHCAKLLKIVQSHPGLTAAEIGEASDIPDGMYQARRRLPDLRRKGLVKNGPDRACAVTGNPSQTWYAE